MAVLGLLAYAVVVAFALLAMHRHRKYRRCAFNLAFGSLGLVTFHSVLNFVRMIVLVFTLIEPQSHSSGTPYEIVFGLLPNIPLLCAYLMVCCVVSLFSRFHAFYTRFVQVYLFWRRLTRRTLHQKHESGRCTRYSMFFASLGLLAICFWNATVYGAFYSTLLFACL